MSYNRYKRKQWLKLVKKTCYITREYARLSYSSVSGYRVDYNLLFLLLILAKYSRLTRYS